MPRPAILLSVLILAAASWLNAAEPEKDWPHFRGMGNDNSVPAANSAQIEHLHTGLRVLWSRALQDDKSLDKGPEYGRYNTYSGPAVAAGKLFVCRRSGTADEVVCIDAATGDDVWRRSLESETVKKNFGGGLRCVPCIHKDFVFVVNYWNVVSCLNRKDGLIVWQKDLLKEYGGKLPDFGTSASPVVLDGRLIVHPCGPGAAVAALDPATGKEIWKGGTHDAAYGTPQLAVIHDVPQIVAFLASGLASFDAATGRELWKFGYYEDWLKNTCFPLIVENRIYVGNNTLGTTALQIEKNGDAWSAKVLWANQREKWHFASAVLGGGNIYFNDGKGAVKCLDSETGKVNWAVHDMGRTWSQVVRIDEQHLLAASDNGQLTVMAVSPKELRTITRYQFLGIAFVQPAVADGRIFVQDFQKVYALALDPKLAENSSGELLKPLPLVPPDHSFYNYYSKNWRTFRVGWFAAGALALLGVSLFYARQAGSSIVLTLLAALGMGIAAYIAATATGPDAKKYSAQRFATMFALYFAGGGAIALAIARIAAERAGRFRAVVVLNALLLFTSVVMLFTLSRSNLALVDIGSILTSAAIRDRTVAFGDIQGALGASFAAMLLLFSQHRFFGGCLAIASWQRGILLIAAAVTFAYCVRHLGAAITLSCALAPAWAALRFKSLPSWHAYWIAPLLAIGGVTFGFYWAFRANAAPGWWGAWSVVIFSALIALFSLPLGRFIPFAAKSGGYLRSPWAVRWTVLSLFILCVLLLDNSINLRAIIKSWSPHNIARYKPDFIQGGAGEWPSFRGPFQNGVVPAGDWPKEFTRPAEAEKADKESKGIAWTSDVPGKGRSSPVVWGSRLFLTTATDSHAAVLCYDADTGALLWNTPIAELDKSEKLPLSGWAAPTGVCDGTHFVALFSSGDLAAFDFSGKIIWKKNLGKLRNMYGYGSSLTFWKDRVIVQLDIDENPSVKPSLFALNPATGETFWSKPRKEGASWSTPVIVRTRSGDQLITCAAPNVVAYNPENGEEIWRAGVLTGDVVPCAVFARGKVIVCNDQAAIAAIDCDGRGDVTSTKVAWRKDGADFPDTASPITNGDYVFLFCSNAKLSCWDVQTGAKVWEKELDNGFTASPLLVGKEIYAFNSNGVLFRIEADETYDESGTFELNENVSATPAFARERIYVRGEHHLFCIGRKAKP